MSDLTAAGSVSQEPERSGAGALDFAAVFRAAPRPLLVVAADPPRFTMVAVNALHAWAFRTTPEALIGHGVLEVFGPNPSPENAAFRDAIGASFERVLKKRSFDIMDIRALPVAGASPGEAEERYWTAINAPVLGPDGTVTHIVSAANDVTGEVLERRNEEARALLMREVDHRARNALAVVQSFVRLTDAPSVEDYRRVLDGRVDALARAQTSLAARRWEGAALRDVVEGELAALAEPGRYALDGEPVLLPAEHVQAMNMAIHELATNAAKYGALSTAEGRIAVSWRKAPDRVVLTWVESAGRPITPPSREGFGSRLVSQLAKQMNGQVAWDWRPEGLAVELSCRLG